MVSVRAVASIYARGQRLWGRIKNERGKWISKSTPYNVGDEELARRYIAAGQRSYNAQRPAAANGPPTVVEYAEKWLAERRTQTLSSFKDDEGRINNHVLKHIGKLLVPEVKSKDIRDMVRELRKQKDLAPRTVRNIYGIAQAMFRDALIDELTEKNPCLLKRGELPAKVDKDPEWRNAATYTCEEVRTLLDDERIPHHRRIQYALKALAGLRHGEVAGLRWRHYEADVEPLGRLSIATSYNKGETKTKVTRPVPVHPELAARLKAWRSVWAARHGHDPGPDDLVVATQQGRLVTANAAGKDMVYDVAKVGLRAKAGSRNRGGHDLRAWFVTECQANGATRDILRVVTHTSLGDVMSGYTRVAWPAICAEIAKLTF